MTKIVYLYFLLGIIFNQQVAQEQQSDFLIEPIDCYNLKYGYAYKLIDNYEEALKSGIVDTLKFNYSEQRKIYTEKAVYLFHIGGGCFTPLLDELHAEVNNDTVKIYWKKKLAEPCPEVGEYEPFCGKISINKSKYPNYKKLRFVNIDNN